MLIFNPRRVLSLRGIDKMFNFLHKNGFIRSTATYLLNGTASHIKIEHIGKLCVLLNCTPNDLFEWRRDASDNLSENHALNSIVKPEMNQINFKEMLKDIPIEKLPQIESLMKELKDG